MSADRTWWKEAVVYQIYPRSFNDADGDGIGDLRGIEAKLDYLSELGVDVVWLNPVYDSPMVDYGYDIRDYRSIHDEYGTMADWKSLRDSLHERGIRLVMDIAINHTSDRHRWFLRSRRGEAPYDEYYHWVEGDPDRPPNDWGSFFGGSAWTYDDVRGAWYLSLFDEAQPDLQWENPAVREEIHDILQWWLERECDGFRLDVVNVLSKSAGYPDGGDGRLPGSEHFVTGPRIHEFVGGMHDQVFDDYDALTIGETVNVAPEEAERFTVEDGLDMVFPFEHVDIDKGDAGPWDVAEWNLPELKRVTERWQTSVGDGWIGVYLGNHDQPRMVSRYGDDGEYRVESAKMLVTLLLTLRGTTYLYQGDEIGMTNAPFETLEQYRDPATIQKVGVAVETQDLTGFEDIADVVASMSRDNARTPMQWSDAPGAGFTSGEPWIMVNPNHTEVNVAAERDDEHSVLGYTRRMVELRDAHPVLVYGGFDLLAEDDPDVFAYRRSSSDEPEDVLVLLNFTHHEPSFELPEAVRLDEADRLLGNYQRSRDAEPGVVDFRPYEARVYRLP